MKIPRLVLANLFFTDTQKVLLKECKLANMEEYKQWVIKNVVLPLTIILIPLIIFLIFKTDVNDFRSLILNGSLSLLGVNILFGMSSYLIRLQKKKSKSTNGDTNNNKDGISEDKLYEDMYHLRERLNNYKNILVVVGAVFYIVQKMFHTYTSDFGLYFFSFLTIVILVLSVYIGRLIFILKDDFVERTFYNDLNKPVLEAKERWQEKYK